jgi:hypothetical protein
MSAQPVQPFDTSRPCVDGRGFATNWFANFLIDLRGRTGGPADKVETASLAAAAAAPASTLVVAGGGLQGGASLAANIGLRLYCVIGTVASLPTSGVTTGDWAYAVDGRKPGEGAGGGTGVPCFWSNASWISVTSGVVVTV